MKQQDYINAYKVIQKYENEKLPLNVSYGLFKVKKLLQDQWDFEVSRETEIYEKYKVSINEDGTFKFETPEDREGFLKDFEELLGMEVVQPIEKIRFDFGDQIQMSVSDIEALSNFVEF